MREETIVVNGYKITLPVGLDYNPKERRDDYASYLTEDKGLKDVRHHLEALTTVLAENIPKTTKAVFHPFGGLGATAQVIQQRAPKSYHIFWERSQTCHDYLVSKWGERKVELVKNSMEQVHKVDLSPFDVIIFDPSLGSILTPGVVEFWDYAATAAPDALIWTSDMARSKLHLNGRSYKRVFGDETWTEEAYADAYDHFLRARGKSILAGAADKFEMYFLVGPKSSRPFTIRRLES